MKIPVYSLQGEAKEHITAANVFSAKVRPDLIARAVVAEQSRNRQPYGADPLAGKRTSAHYHGKRHYRYSMMNKEMARMKRIHNQGYLNLTARFVPQAVKGRKAHPPKAEKNWVKKINKKERVKALFSAISATASKDLVVSRGHKPNGIKHIPLVLEDNFQDIKKTKEVMQILEKMGLGEEIERTSERAVRAGRGKTRGRKYRNKKGPLIIVKESKGIEKAAKNIPGVDVVDIKSLSVELLAPGTHPGRLCIWTKSAVEELDRSAI